MAVTWAVARMAAAVSPRLAGVAASRLWFIPWRQRPSDNTLAKWDAWLAGSERWSPSGRPDLAAFRAGEGPPVLLVHGWADRAATLGAFVAPLTAAGFQVVGIDMPAHGESPGRRTDAFRWVDAVAAVEREVGALHAVIAHSFGALATALAVRDGLAVGRLALIAPAVRMESTLERFGVQARLPRHVLAALRQEISRRYGPGIWSELATDRLLEGLALPTLVLHDEDDTEVPVTDAALLSGVLERCELVRTSGLGHRAIVRDPHVVELVTAFVASHAPARLKAAGLTSGR